MATNKQRSFKKAMKLKKEGNVLYENGKFEWAIGKYRKGIELCRKNKPGELALLYQNRAACFEALHEWHKVIDDCTEAIIFNNLYYKVYKRRGKAYEKLGRLNDGLRDLAVVCALSPKEKLLDEYNSLLCKFGEEKGKEFFQSRGEVPISDDVIRSHFELFTSNGFVDGDVNKKVLQDKIEELRNASDEDRFLKINAIEGTIQFFKLKYSEVQNNFSTVVDSNCNEKLKVYSFIMLAHCSFHAMLLGTENETAVPKIMQLFDDALSVDQSNGDIYFHRTPVVDYLNHGNHDRSIDCLKKCLELSPKNYTAKAQLLYYRALNSIAGGDKYEVNEIINSFCENIIIHPNSTAFIYGCLASLGTIAHTFDVFHLVDDCVKYALRSRSNNEINLIHKAFVRLFSCIPKCGGCGKCLLSDIADVFRMFINAVEADEECEFGHEMLAFFYASQTNFSESMKHLDKALKLARSEEECVNLIRFKALLESQTYVIENRKERNIKSVFQTIVKRKMEQSHVKILVNWYHKHINNGFPIAGSILYYDFS